VKLLIDGILHIEFNANKLLGVHAYIDKEARYQWQIEIVLEGNTITTEYTSREKWEQVLTELEKVI
jgi:hypothetical protein